MGTSEFISTILPLKNHLMRAAFRITGDVADSERIVQDVMLRLWAERRSWMVIEDLPTYCLAMTRNMALKSVQQKEDIGFTEDKEVAIA